MGVQADRTKAFVVGCAGTVLEADEIAFLEEHRPFGLILFARNCETPDQVRALCETFRKAIADPQAPVLIDQEGGRVQRMKPPHWDRYAPPGRIGTLFSEDAESAERAAWLHGRLMAEDLAAVGIDIDCAPVLDVLQPGASDAIGDRSFGNDPAMVSTLGASLAKGLRDGGVLPVVKHIPGQGRALLDSHFDLPVVDADVATLAATDFVPFATVTGIEIAMTGHIVYSEIDRINPATTSPEVIGKIVREQIGFDGLLLSDDASMHALSGDYEERGRAIRDAGCDLVLHCNGRAEEMRAIADAVPVLSGKAAERADRVRKALEWAKQSVVEIDRRASREEYLALMLRAGWPQTTA